MEGGKESRRLIFEQNSLLMIIVINKTLVYENFLHNRTALYLNKENEIL